MEFDPSEMTTGEAAAYRAGFAEGFAKAKGQALDLLEPEHEGIIAACCEVSVDVIKGIVADMEPEG